MIIDNPQPQPGPSPTPTPKPVAALQILSISHVNASGGATLTLPAPFGGLEVSKDFMDLNPMVGGYYAVSANAKWFMEDQDYSARFPQT